jgi:hypothetical protein
LVPLSLGFGRRVSRADHDKLLGVPSPSLRSASSLRASNIHQTAHGEISFLETHLSLNCFWIVSRKFSTNLSIFKRVLSSRQELPKRRIGGCTMPTFPEMLCSTTYHAAPLNSVSLSPSPFHFAIHVQNLNYKFSV